MTTQTHTTIIKRVKKKMKCISDAHYDDEDHVVPIALLVRVQCLRRSLHVDVEGPSTR